MTTEKDKCTVCNGDKKVVVGDGDLVTCLFCMGTGREKKEPSDWIKEGLETLTGFDEIGEALWGKKKEDEDNG